MNLNAIMAIYRFEMARFFRTIWQSMVSPVISTSLYFVVFGAAIAAWAVSQRAANLLQRGVWLANDHRRGPASIGAAGAVVASLATEVFPKAFKEDHYFAGIATTLGLLLALALSNLSG